jgi:transcriptional regulator with XRE-family HTH domain
MPAKTSIPRNAEGELVSMIVARRLRDERLNRHIYISEVARAIGLSHSQVARIEVGDRPLRIGDAWLMAKAIGVDLKDMLP